MRASTVVKTDPAGNIKPDKEKSVQKIDGIVADAVKKNIITPSGNFQVKHCSSLGKCLFLSDR